MGFIIVVAGRAFSDATGMRIRSQNMLGSAEEAGRVSAILKEDISQMGAKSWGRSSASGTAFDTVASVYIDFNDGLSAASTDLSSYVLTRNYSASSNDHLRLRKAYFDASGVCGGIMEVEWYVRGADSTLLRKCTRLTAPSKCSGSFDTNECPNGTEVEMARDVVNFRLLPSVPGIEGSSSASSADILFPTASASSFNLIGKNSDNSGYSPYLYGGGNRVIIGSHDAVPAANKFVQNSSSSVDAKYVNFYLAEPNQTANCKQFKFNKGEEYVVSFDLLHEVNGNDPCRTGGSSCAVDLNNRYNEMSMFQPGRDHLSVGLRTNDMNGTPITYGGTALPDFLFYPPQDAKANSISRHFEFSVPETKDACIGITAAFYSQAANGHLDIANFKVSRKTDNIYHFNRSSGSNYNPSASSKAGVKAFELTLGINKRGEINRTITVIPVPNNGVLATLATGGN